MSGYDATLLLLTSFATRKWVSVINIKHIMLCGAVVGDWYIQRAREGERERGVEGRKG